MNTTGQNEQMKELSDHLWEYFKPKILELLSSKVGFYRAKVLSNPGGNQLRVQKPFDDTILNLPCVDSIANASAGSQVVVLTFGDASSAIVIGDGMLTNL